MKEAKLPNWGGDGGRETRVLVLQVPRAVSPGLLGGFVVSSHCRQRSFQGGKRGEEGARSLVWRWFWFSLY